MWTEIFRFELRYHLKQPLFIISSLALFAISLMIVSTDMGVSFAGGTGATYRNAPLVIINSTMILSILGLFVITAFVSNTAQRDFELGTHELFFTKPVSKFHYLTGRLAGSLTVGMLVFALGSLGLLGGAIVPWQDPSRVAPFTLVPLLYGLLIIVLPNLLVMGTIFFTVTILGRRMLLTYIGVVIFWFLQDAVETWALGLDNPILGALFDPIGAAALRIITRYWTVSEFNTMLPTPGAGLLLNRLVWLVISGIIFWMGYHCFSYTRALKGRAGKAEGDKKNKTSITPGIVQSIQPGRVFNRRTTWYQLLAQTRLETGLVLGSNGFLILLLLGLVFVLTFAYYHGTHDGTALYPVTGMMILVNQLNMSIFLTIIVIFYSGEVVWRERSLRQDGIIDSMPTPGIVYLGAKALTMIAIVMVFIVTCALGTIAFQLSCGYTRLQPGLYLTGILIMASSIILIALLGICVQCVVNNKFLGFLVMVLLMCETIALPKLGIIHRLLLFPGSSRYIHSDMNGYGHLLAPFVWIKLYWHFGLAALMIVVAGLRVRGEDKSLKARWIVLKAHLNHRTRIILGLLLTGFLATGAFVFYNTNILNTYMTPAMEREWQADYERIFGQYRDLAQPRLTSVNTDVDIFPEQRRVEIRGVYTLENRTSEILTAVHVTLDPTIKINALICAGQSTIESDPKLGYHIFDLSQPMAPGDISELTFDLAIENHGFVNNDPDNSIVANGTFFNNRDCFPTIGYVEHLQLSDPGQRRRAHLPPVPRLKDRDDPTGLQNNYVSSQGDWINFEATVSTSADQIALAPGTLQKEWELDGRHFFHYKMGTPILDFFAFLSADYSVRRDQWNDVEIEVFYHAEHSVNVDQMIASVKASLDYYTTNFGPYQHPQVRIVEFPIYRLFAQAFPGTIPFSEGMGFITRLDPQKGHRLRLQHNRT